MAYTKTDAYNAVNSIYGLKGDWHSADKVGDEAKKKAAAEKAKAYYDELTANGYADTAEKLSKSNYEQSKAIKDYYAAIGKSSINDYMYSLGKADGLSQSDIDNLIKYDSVTGEVTFGGKNIGKPDAVSSNGVAYFGDTGTLDSAYGDYKKRSGTTPSYEALGLQNSAGVKDKTDELWGMQKSDHSTMNDLYTKEYNYLRETNPFETDVGQSIMADYNLKALQGRDNAAASGAADNGGNIDSFAAANALRQQAALTAQGQNVALAAHQQRLDNAKSLLESMGVSQQNSYAGMQNTIGIQQNEAQRTFENSETIKNNDLTRDIATSEVTGVIPERMTYSNNPFFNSDGTLKDESTDFKAIIENARARGDKVTENYAKVARAKKLFGNYSKYGVWDDGDYAFAEALPTASVTAADKDRELNKELAEMEADSNKYAIDTEAQVARDGYASNERITAANNASAEKISGADDNPLSGADYTELYNDIRDAVNKGKDKYAILSAFADTYGYNSDEYKFAVSSIDELLESGSTPVFA